MMTRMILPTLCTLMALGACDELATPANDTPTGTQGQSAPALPQPETQAEYLLWSPEEQLVGYRNIDRIFDTRLVPAGREPRPLPRASEELDVSYEFNGERWTTDTYMERNNVVGLLVIVDGEIVLESYREAYGPDQRWISFSAAKSITSTLVGIALQEGAIGSLQDSLEQYLPELEGSAYEGVTIQQLLTMTTGAEWNEDYADMSSDVALIKSEPSVNGSDPIVTYMARLKRAAEPGTRFHYSTGETHLAGSLVRAATGMDLARYLSEKIWIPYGMELDANWMVLPAGMEQAGCCLSAGLRDLGRFGQFMLEGARIDGVRVVPDDWLRQAMTPTAASRRSTEVPEARQGYGYMWWIFDESTFTASGAFGQIIHVDPPRRLVIVEQSAWPEPLSGFGMRAPFTKAVEAAVTPL